jgi:hypothetical protein
MKNEFMDMFDKWLQADALISMLEHDFKIACEVSGKAISKAKMSEICANVSQNWDDIFWAQEHADNAAVISWGMLRANERLEKATSMREAIVREMEDQ